MRILIDGMGGDFAPEPIVKGTLAALEKFNNIEITIFGDQEKMGPFLKDHDRLKVVHTPDYLDMGEKDPIKAYRTNKELSMFKENTSTGNNGGSSIVQPQSGSKEFEDAVLNAMD